VVAEEAYFADSKKDGDTSNFENTFGTSMQTDSSSEFSVSSEDDLPFK
jgi:hypothetical protein